MKNLRLLSKQIMTLPAPEEDKIGLIIIPDKRDKKSDEKPEKFEVLAVGSGVSPEIQPGKYIVAGKYSGNWQKFDGQDYYFISEDSDAIHAVIDPPDVEESNEAVDVNDPAYQ